MKLSRVKAEYGGAKSWSRRAIRLIRVQRLSGAGAEKEQGWKLPLRGQGLVEFALILPILMLIIIGIFEFGLAYFDNGKVEYTAREVARRAAICGNACDGQPTLSSGITSTFQLDYLDLDAVANQYNGPNNASLANPALIQYIWIQRTYDDGRAIPVTGTVTTTLTYDSTRTDYRRYFNYYVYDPNWLTDNSSVPFISPAGSCTSDPWVNNHDYDSIVGIGAHPYTQASSCINWRSSKDPTTGATGRNVCEPTDRFYVEVAYKHYWITPLIPSTNGYITLKNRVYMKIEPHFFVTNNIAGASPNASCT